MLLFASREGQVNACSSLVGKQLEWRRTVHAKCLRDQHFFVPRSCWHRRFFVFPTQVNESANARVEGAWGVSRRFKKQGLCSLERTPELEGASPFTTDEQFAVRANVDAHDPSTVTSECSKQLPIVR